MAKDKTDAQERSSASTTSGRMMARTSAAVRAVIKGISSRRRTEDARAGEERLRSTLDRLLEGFQCIGFDWRYMYVNEAVARHGRRTKEELLGRTMMEMYPGIQDTDMFAYLKRCMEERIPHRMENEFTYPDGTKAWFELRIEPAPGGISILSLDISERRQAEEALRKLSSAVEQSAESVVITDRDGIIEYVNPAFERLAGYAKQEVIGKTPRILKSGKHGDEFYRALWETILSGQVYQAEFINKKKDGELYDEERVIAALRDRQGNITHFVATGRDITERKRAEEALREAREELEGKVERQLLRRNPYGLTFRELTILYLVAAGKSDKEIGTELDISPLTAQKHISNILAKMGAASRTEASVRAVREGLLD